MPRCSLAVSNFSSVHLFMALHWELFDMFDHSSDQTFRSLAVTCFFVSLPWTHVGLLVDFCWATRIVLHRSRVQTVTGLHLYSNDHRWLPHEVHQCSFSFVSGHQCYSEVSENRPSEHGVPSSEQHDSDIFNLQEYNRNLVELQHLDLNLALLLIFLKDIVEILAWGRLPLCTQRWITAVLLARFRPSSMMNTNSLSLFWMSTSFDLNLLTLISECDIALKSFVSTLNRSPVQLLASFKAYPIYIPGKTFVPNWCTRPWSFDDVGQNFNSAPNGMIGPSIGELNKRRSYDVWAYASRSCTSRRKQITLHWSCPPAFLKSRLNAYWQRAFFHSSYRSFCNSMCFGSARFRYLMIPFQLFESFD